jgi:putative spermidine/putrescine transport system permease protein
VSASSTPAEPGVAVPEESEGRSARVGLLALPLLVVYVAFFLGSQIVFLRQGFFTSIGFGQIDYGQATLHNLTSVFTDSFNRAVVMRTLYFSAIVVAGCLLLGYPLAYVIARSGRIGGILLVIVVASSFSGTVARILGWEVILGDTGPVNSLLVDLGILSHPTRLVNNLTGAIIGTVQVMLPFMVLILVPSIQAIDVDVENAAIGMGASRWRIWRTILWPLSIPGVAAGSLLVFATTAGTFTTPALLGGGKTQILPIVINSQVGVTLNYPQAAAMALVLLALVLVITYSTDLVSRRRVIV